MGRIRFKPACQVRGEEEAVSAMMDDSQAPDVDPAIRRARPAEASVLSALAMRSNTKSG
jgi:hypothetical protein